MIANMNGKFSRQKFLEGFLCGCVWSAGVTSFNIDFAAKKVTVVGDVTPLSVLASISKVSIVI